MVVWVIVIFLLGLILSFGANTITSPQVIRLIGIAIMAICMGIAARSTYLTKKGEKEQLKRKIQELEKSGESKK